VANYRKLTIWADGIDFATKVYFHLSSSKDFGLKDQITRSAVSIASNIAEGAERDSDADFVRFLRIAKASAAECRTQMIIARNIGVLSNPEFDKLDQEAASLGNRISSLIKFLRKQ
jgi:four helix bundle protein